MASTHAYHESSNSQEEEEAVKRKTLDVFLVLPTLAIRKDSGFNRRQ